MADVSKLTLQISAITDLRDAESAFTKLQKQINTMGLPKNLQSKFDEIFTSGIKGAQKMSEAIANSFKGKGDASKFTQGLNEVNKAFKDIEHTFETAKLDKNILNTPVIEDARQKITEYEAAVKSAGESLKDIKYNSKSFNAFKEALASGDIKTATTEINKLAGAYAKATREGHEATANEKLLIEAYDAAKNILTKYGSTINEVGDSTKLYEQLEVALNDALKQATTAFENNAGAVGKTRVEILKLGDATKKEAEEQTRLNRELDAMKSRVEYFFGLQNAINLFRRAVRSAYNDVKALDKVMTETAVVTNFSVGDMWERLPEYTKRANELGVSIQSVYEADRLFYQQGLKTNEVIQVSTETMKMARIAGLDAATATDRMTNALRGFNMEINEASAQRINDVYSRLAAITASDVDEISTAMTKVASLANSANMEFEKTSAFLAQIIETTRESAETAGTALKTIVARFSEVKKLYSEGQLMGTDEEGEEIQVNRVATALQTAGISMNEFFLGTKGLDDILMELAEKWDSLDTVQQRYIATMAAGSRQQSRFIALMQDYKRTVELVEEAENAAGASNEQFAKTLESLDVKLSKLKNAWTTFTTGITNAEIIKKAVDGLTQLISIINKLTEKTSGWKKSLLSIGIAIGAFKIGRKVLGGLVGNFVKTFQKAGQQGSYGFLSSFKTTMKASLPKYQIDGAALFKADSIAKQAKIISNDVAIGMNTSVDAAHNLRAAYLSLTPAQAQSYALMSKSTRQKYLDAIAAGDDAAATQALNSAVATQNGLNRGGIIGFATRIGLLVRDNAVTAGGTGIKWADVKAMLAQTAAQMGLNSAMLIGLGIIGLIIAAIALLVFGIKKLVEYIKSQSPEAKMERAAEAAEKLHDKVAELKEEYEDLSSKGEELNNLIETQRNLSKSADEWKEGIESINASVSELLGNYDELANYLVYDETLGTWIISKEGLEKVTQDKQTKAVAAAMEAANADTEAWKKTKTFLKDKYTKSVFVEGPTGIGSWENRTMSDEELDTLRLLAMGDLDTILSYGGNMKDYNKASDKEEYALKLMSSKQPSKVQYHRDYSKQEDIDKRMKILAENDSFLSNDSLTSLRSTLIQNLETDTEKALAKDISQDTIQYFVDKYGYEAGARMLLNTIKNVATDEALQQFVKSGGRQGLISTLGGLGAYSGDSSKIVKDFTRRYNGNERVDVPGAGEMSTLAKVTYDAFDAVFDLDTTPTWYTDAISQFTTEWLSESQVFPFLDKSRISAQATGQSSEAVAKGMSDDLNKLFNRTELDEDEITQLRAFLTASTTNWGERSTWTTFKNMLKEYGVSDEAASNYAASFIKLNKALNTSGVDKYTESLQQSADIINKLEENTREFSDEEKNFLLNQGFTEQDFSGNILLGNLNDAIDKLSKKSAGELQETINDYEHARSRQFFDKSVGEGTVDAVWNNLLAQLEAIGVYGANVNLSEILASALEQTYTAQQRIEVIDALARGVEGAVGATDELYLALLDVKNAEDEASQSMAIYKLSLLQTATNIPVKKFEALGSAIQEANTYLAQDDVENYRLTLSAVTKTLQEAFGNDQITVDFVEQYKDTLLEMADGSEEAFQIIQQAIIDTFAPDIQEKLEQGTKDGLGIITLEVLETEEATQGLIDQLNMIGYVAEQVGDQIIAFNAAQYAFQQKMIQSGESAADSAKDWENPYDHLYNHLAKITSLQRERNKLEREYNALVKTEADTQEAVTEKIKERTNKIREEMAYQRGTIAARTNDIYNLQASSGLADYAWYDAASGRVNINWDKINSITDADEGQKVQDYVSKLEGYVSDIDSATDNIYDLEDTLDDMYRSQLESYAGWENRIAEALATDAQRRIDELSKINDTINEVNSSIFDAAQKQIDAERQARENEKKEQEITDKEARLAYLRRDTSGANALEIKKLEEELTDSRQSYADTLVDQALEKMREDADAASDQRAKQIELLEEQLEFDKEHTFIHEAEQIAAEGDVNKIFDLLSGAELLGNKSKVGQTLWTQDFYRDYNANSQANLNSALYEGNNDHKVATKNTDINTSVLKEQNEKEKSYDKAYQDNLSNGRALISTAGKTVEEIESMRQYYNSQGLYANYMSNFNELWVTDPTQYPGAQTYIAKVKAAQAAGNWTTTNGLKVEFGDEATAQAAATFYAYKIGQYSASRDGNVVYLKGRGPLGAFATGGLVTSTGPAWLDGTKSSPEYVLNAAQTEGFLQLVNMFTKPQNAFSSTSGFGDNYFDIDINAEIGSDYDVDQLVERIKTRITEDAMYRNVNAINFIR